MLTLIMLSVVVFGVTITPLFIITALLGLWELFGRLFPTTGSNPPTWLSWIIQALNWLNTILNHKK